jgi:hypothetical protein
MALPSTGKITMQQVNTELRRPATQRITLNDSGVRSLAVKPSGTISMNNLHGKIHTLPVNVVIYQKEIVDLTTIDVNYNVYSCILRVHNKNVSGGRRLIVQVKDGSRIDLKSNETRDVSLLQGYGHRVIFSLSGEGRLEVTATLIGQVYP